MGFVGTEAAIAFTTFVEGYETVVSAEDILDDYKNVKGRVKELTNDRLNAVIDKLATHCKNNEWTEAQAKNVGTFAKSLPGEMMVSLWNNISGTQKLPNIQKIHKLIGQDIVKAVQASRNV